MSRGSLARRERLALCDLFTELGPDAPTMCGEWRTSDLAAHLVVRERNLLALPGVAGGPFARLSDRLTQRAKAETPYEELVALLRDGPPLGPLGLPGLDDATNLVEFAMHHEDVRRAQGWGPRPGLADLQDALWPRVVLLGRILMRRTPTGVVLRATSGRSTTAKGGTPSVTVIGEPLELLLFAWGRQAVADVEMDGPAEAVGAIVGLRG